MRELNVDETIEALDRVMKIYAQDPRERKIKEFVGILNVYRNYRSDGSFETMTYIKSTNRVLYISPVALLDYLRVVRIAPGELIAEMENQSGTEYAYLFKDFLFPLENLAILADL